MFLVQQLRCSLVYLHPIIRLPGFKPFLHSAPNLFPIIEHCKRQQTLYQVLGSMPTMWETQIELWASDVMGIWGASQHIQIPVSVF